MSFNQGVQSPWYGNVCGKGDTLPTKPYTINGKKHTNYNSEASRDKAVEDYINRLYTEFSENGDGMLAMADNIERRLSGYSVYG